MLVLSASLFFHKLLDKDSKMGLKCLTNVISTTRLVQIKSKIKDCSSLYIYLFLLFFFIKINFSYGAIQGCMACTLLFPVFQHAVCQIKFTSTIFCFIKIAYLGNNLKRNNNLKLQ